MKELKLISNQQNQGQRLDKFLVEKLAETEIKISRSHLQSLIADGKISNYQTKIIIKDNAYKIKADEEFLLEIPEAIPTKIAASDIPIKVIWQDETMLVIDKQAGLTTHPGNGNQNQTLVNALIYLYGQNLSAINGVMRPGIVHRLDKDTSGLMVVAKNDLAHNELARQIEQRILKRNYLAICSGVPKPLTGIINKNIGRSKTNRLKMVVMKIGGKSAITNYEVKKIYHNSIAAMVECKLDTGRTHQLRVHFAAIGCPLIGDSIYGNRKRILPELNFIRQALHSYKISFLHPINQKLMEFEIPLPSDLEELDKRLS